MYKDYKAVLMFAISGYKSQFSYKGAFGMDSTPQFKWIGKSGLVKPSVKTRTLAPIHYNPIEVQIHTQGDCGSHILKQRGY